VLLKSFKIVTHFSSSTTYEGLPLEQHHKMETKKTAVQRKSKMEEIKGD
jgi:hypothetical protein